MKIKSYILLWAVLLLGVSAAEGQDLKLWYDRPAKEWVEALPIGNGRLGAMVFGGVADDRIQFNEETLWSGGPRDYNRKGAYRYLDSIRGLLFAGKQKEAEQLAGREFLGVRSNEGARQAWIVKMKAIQQQKDNPSATAYNDRNWKMIRVPHYEGWEKEGLAELDGAVWFRTSFELPANWKNQPLELDLGSIAGQDICFVNGIQVSTQDNGALRKYRVPGSALKTGKNSIAIQVLNMAGKGGILGYKDSGKTMGIYPAGKQEAKLLLEGVWKYWVQSDKVPPEEEYQARYQPFGDIHFYSDVDTASVTQYKRVLSLEDATLTTSYKSNGTTFKRTYIASVPGQVIAVNFTADRAGAISFATAVSSPHRDFILKKIDPHTVALHVQVKDGALFGESYVRVTTKSGNITVENNRLVVSGADEATVWITAATNYRNYKDVSGQPAALCKAALQKTDQLTFASLLRDHIKEYQQYFNTLSVDFSNPAVQNRNEQLPTDQRLARFSRSGDPEFVALYLQYGRYLLISSSRPGTYPPNLQGIWNDLLSPPWGSKYTTNINAEMNYWPAELLGLSPLHSAFFRMTQEVAASGRETAGEYYRAPGWVLHHNTDLWRGTAPINASDHGIWVTGGAWFCEHLWERYLFTKNERFLRDTAYPIMKEAALFFNTFMVKDPVSGYLISTPSNSPEQGGLVAGPTMDHQIIRALFKNTIEASKILKRDAAFRKELEDKYPRIAPNKIGRYGQLQEWMQDVDDTTNKHRHVSHLWAVYPGSEINWETTPDLMKAARQSLIYRGDAATGWSLGWKINLWARFKDGDHTYKLIRMLLSPAGRGAGSYPNLFDAHPPFQIDGNFGGAAGIGEMLVQSHAGLIDILPALPDALPGGWINGIHARGGLVLDMKWENKQLTTLTIRTIADGRATLRYNGAVLPFTFKKGKRYEVAPGFKDIKEL
ncbi:glycoside hydrolase family 95 protein [Niabella drilacis]|uniref:Alpha-L-fucosidase 2 n=1 Tax=Niabella drilacis (strain DSM 25811 / CCM 8410 / CCUG 62505 / LMG 26954 / E90) TaxID=1285928 RepID=A0A1G6ZRF9_NIADE|nr:glycoside hydrolase family 95 protein [Niabella drilacis]SDE05130.1 alpha-L-fucosidase 2 [Niabella drilacis]